VAGGEALLSPSVTRRLIEEFAAQVPVDRSATEKLSTLTERELEVLTHVGHGLTNAEIAEAVFISESTAKTHLKRLVMKLGLCDAVAAVVFAYEAGLVKPGRAETSPQPERG
jgi:DNA-binding NarL/FixJ family response regulator